jgi:predicted phosphodiesterase/DNA replication protein DnaC
MIKIIHISDLHLESSNPSFEKKDIIAALAEDIKKYVDDSTLLFYTGDLIHRGGVEFKEDKPNAFKRFEELFITPILTSNPTLKNKIFIVPGNHDVFREKIDPISEDGLKSNLTSHKNVTEFIINNRNNFRHLDRISDYKNWEKDFYSTYPNGILSLFENTFMLKVGLMNVGISCLNSSWLCKDDNDKENLIIGRNQIENSLDRIKSCQVKLALSHHPLEFLTEFDRDPVKIELYKNYDILFTGHVHELASSYTQDLYGNIFISIANSTIGDHPKERKFVNGYTILELSPNEKIKTYYRKYIEDHKKFVPNTEIGTEDGAKEWQILKDEKLTKFVIVATIVDGIANRHCEKLNEDLIMATNSTNAPCSIDSLFVEPTILNCPQNSLKESQTIHYDIEKILSRKANFLIYGLKESGKTILLNKLFLEAIRKFNQFNKIPIYLKFSDFKTKDIEKVIREYLGQPTKAIKELLTENNSLIFIDDLSFSEKNASQISALKELIQKYPKIQIIATADQATENSIPTDYLDHNDILNFEVGFIQNLNSHEIKELIGKWFVGKEVDFQENMEKLMKCFVDFGLPKTPLSVTMFLWIFERQEKRPLNNSVLVEMFIENLLEKTNIENIYSETFDFKNKQRFLSFISKFMRDNGDEELSYSVNYVKLLEFADEYLKTRFSGKPQKVIEDLIKRGILCYEDDNLVRFKSAFFFHYFLALHFDYDPKFKKHVLTGENYLYYIEEIVYYTGLKRDDVELLHFTQTKLHEAFGDFNADVAVNHEKVDRVLETRQKSQTLAFNVPQEQIENKPSETQMEAIYDEQLSAIPVQKNVPKKSGQDFATKKNIDKVLKLASNVLKNSEDVDDIEAKTLAYKNTLLSAISCMIQERDALILFYTHFKKKPDHLPKNIDFNLFIQVVPMIYQVVIFNWLGTQKLRPVLTDKMDRDKLTLNISEFEKFLSIFIYSDIRGAEYPERIEQFVKQTKFNYVKDLSFLKIISYYYLRNNTKELNKKYLKLLSDIKEDLGQLDKHRKSEFMREIEEKKEKDN